MNILFVHQNFPGQFPHLAPALAQRGHRVLALTTESNTRPSLPGVELFKYRTPEPPALEGRVGRVYAEMSERGYRVARAALLLRERENFTPDVIFGHPGWGETLFLREVWPEARLIVYAEFMYHTTGLDTDFDAELQRLTIDGRIGTVARSAHLQQSLLMADAALSPTEWQASTHPPELRHKITVLHDGIATQALAPNPEARLPIPGTDLVFRPGDEVVSFVNRSLEPYRGYHRFIRALPAVLAARPNAHVVIVGAEGQSYGSKPTGAVSWKEQFLSEVRDRMDMSRVHFLGRVPYAAYTSLLRVARVHAYLTYPFVLSWSLIEAMAAGVPILASDTPPLHDAITDGVHGRLIGFFDQPGWETGLIDALARPEAYADMAAAARKRAVEEFDLSVTLPRLIRFVESGGRES